MARTKKEQGWQNTPKSGAYTLKESKIVAEKPESLKKKEIEEKKEKDKENEKKGFYGRTTGYSPIRRRTNGGIVRLKRRNA